MSKNDILELEKVHRKEAKMIKGFKVIQAMPGWSGTLLFEEDMIQGAPLSSAMSWLAQSSSIRIVCFLCPPAQQLEPMKWNQWDTDYSHNSHNSRKRLLKS